MSQHLAVLEEAGLVTTRHEGRYKFHTIRPEPLRGLVDRWLAGPPAPAPDDADEEGPPR